MTIQWFPGHMTRARRQIEDKLKLIDIAIELLDARVPMSSRNPMVDDILRGKPRLILLNKADLADSRETERWMQYFASKGYVSLAVDSSTGSRVNEIPVKVREILHEKIQRMLDRGMNPRAMRALIVGIPNVGKSTLTNRLAGRHIAATGDRPGVTKGQQWIKVGSEMELLDTPGILWPKFEDQLVGYKLAMTGAIKEQVLNIEDVAYFAVRVLVERYWPEMQERFGLEEQPEDFDDNLQIVGVMEQIGRNRGCLLSGGRIDLEKVSGIILRELRAGKLGRLTLEAAPPARP
ncbi:MULTISPECIES: ribosome biogenesis GTPase YlqF [unclassified Paenibacillus]|uniref:ribosome biogenesis GTPase YlqF n=1 Tax=unclassified Paenibacillus TaxID=185978 RepID=UPI000955AF13|nr:MULTISPECIES: ribosome biogenesis GTPase YlqF [unclassified Paenibacillus]ASS65736.1 ribosome biogenesis GTPase YlqF [Paenibacillus sp. RUD330]SIQ25869.1 ribosome biogenesis GTPase A [Paenibacillus sp. RU4X]SIQ47632.1 ribosome biogenesis GTPase A [Paenibacillus sp. RU4T]